jgi:hypothetical protein
MNYCTSGGRCVGVEQMLYRIMLANNQGLHWLPNQICSPSMRLFNTNQAVATSGSENIGEHRRYAVDLVSDLAWGSGLPSVVLYCNYCTVLY